MNKKTYWMVKVQLKRQRKPYFVSILFHTMKEAEKEAVECRLVPFTKFAHVVKVKIVEVEDE